MHLYGLNRLASVDGGGTRTWEIHDALGSVRQRLDDAATPLGSTSYTPFGVPQTSTPDPFGFTGELHSEGLVYLRARWYDPAGGVFTGRDPFAGFPETPYSLHYYQYGYSNPVLYTDASGQNPAYACLPVALADSPFPGPADAAAGVCFVVVGGLWFIGTWVMAQPGTQEFIQDTVQQFAPSPGYINPTTVTETEDATFQPVRPNPGPTDVPPILLLPKEVMDELCQPTITPDTDPRPEPTPTLTPTPAPTPTPGPKQCDPKKCAQWKASLATRPISNPTADWAVYQAKHAGNSEYQAIGGGTNIWADGIRTSDCTFIETKHVKNVKSSPYVPGSSTPPFLQQRADINVESEIARYTAIINDPNTPMVGLEIVTNENAAVSYFQGFIGKHRTPGGHVIVKP